MFIVFLPRARQASAAILVDSVLLGIIIGVTEEILWRGVHATIPRQWRLNLAYPSVMFALWHLAPWLVMTNRLGGVAHAIWFTPPA